MADDAEAQVRCARAARLREQIDRLKDGEGPPADKAGGAGTDGKPPSPLDFIRDRMREMDHDGDKGGQPVPLP